MSENQFLERLRNDIGAVPEKPPVVARRRFSASLNEVVWDVYHEEDRRVLACVRGKDAERRAVNLAADYARMWKRFVQEDRDAANRKG